MATGYSDVVTDPEAFFDRELEDTSVLAPLGLVLLVGVLTAAAGWIGSQRTSQLTTELMQKQAENPEAADMFSNITGIATGISAVVGFLGAFLALLFYAAFFHGVSGLLDGEGGFKRTLAVTGWGFVPKVVEELLALLANIYVRQAVPMPENVTQQSVNEFTRQVSTHPTKLLVFLLGLVGLLISAYIWVAGMQKARRLDRRGALISVAIPVGLVVLLRIGLTLPRFL